MTGDGTGVALPEVTRVPWAGHVCPPTTAPEMLARLADLEKNYTTRLTNQRQVIENLDNARKAALDQLADHRAFLQDLLDNGVLQGETLERAKLLAMLP